MPTYQAPIESMSLEETEKSMLLQIQELRSHYDIVQDMDVSELNPMEISILVSNISVRENNLHQTYDRILMLREVKAVEEAQNEEQEPQTTEAPAADVDVNVEANPGPETGDPASEPDGSNGEDE